MTEAADEVAGGNGWIIILILIVLLVGALAIFFRGTIKSFIDNLPSFGIFLSLNY